MNARDIPSEKSVVEPSLDALAPSRPTASLAQVVIATVLVVALLRFAQSFFVPLLLGILTSYTLDRPVTWLKRMHIPRSLGAALVLGLVVSLCVLGGYTLSDDAGKLADELPTTAKKLRQTLRQYTNGGTSTLASVQKAATELERAAAEAAGSKVAVLERESSSSILRTYLATGTSSTLGVMSQLFVATLIAYFLLAAGDAFRRKLAHIAGPSLARRRMTIEALNEVHDQVQGYMVILVVTNVLIGLATWALFAALGLSGAALWGVFAGLLHIVPYAGSAILAVAACVAGIVQFESVSSGLLLAGGALVIATAIGTGLNTWLNSRYTRMNPVVVFAGVLFFGWLWGAWGLLLAVPLLAVLKAISERMHGMRAIAELMQH